MQALVLRSVPYVEFDSVGESTADDFFLIYPLSRSNGHAVSQVRHRRDAGATALAVGRSAGARVEFRGRHRFDIHEEGLACERQRRSYA